MHGSPTRDSVHLVLVVREERNRQTHRQYNRNNREDRACEDRYADLAVFTLNLQGHSKESVVLLQVRLVGFACCGQRVILVLGQRCADHELQQAIS